MPSYKLTTAMGMLLTPTLVLGQGCGGSDFPGVRINYEAYIPSVTVPMAPFSEVERNFPDARGVTQRTVFVTPDRVVDVQRGTGIKATVTRNIQSPAPGVHFRGQDGKEITFVGYEQVPVHFIKIQTRTEKISYSSLTGEARRRQAAERDSDTLEAMVALEAQGQSIGEREYGGVRCTQKRIPMQGPRTEACVHNFHGWPVALYLQFDLPTAGGLQWYRATNVTPISCISPSEVSLPQGVAIVDKRQRS